MSGLKKIFDTPMLLATISAAMMLGIVLKMLYDGRSKPAFVPMVLSCVDTQGKMATQDNTLRYFRDGGTLIGYDADGFYYVYTPPVGWVCRYGEKKK